MTRYKISSKDNLLLFSESLKDRLDKNDEVFGFDTLIDQIDVRVIERKYSTLGSKCFDPRTMVKVLFYGYRKGIFSSRKLAWASRSIIQFIYLTGDLKIAHRTLADFRANNAAELGVIFQEIVRLGFRLGIVEGKKGYQDGVKMKANASNQGFRTKSEWEKHAAEIKADIAGYLANAKQTDADEDKLYGKDTEGNHIDASRSELKEKVAELLKEDKEITPEKKEEIAAKAAEADKIDTMLAAHTTTPVDTKINPTDPDARFMKSHGKIESSFNGQIITENQFITAADVTTDATDFDQAGSIVTQHAKNLPEAKLEKYGADAGYSSGRNLESMHKSGITTFIPEHNEQYLRENPEAEKFEQSAFIYDEEADEYICPRGMTLEFKKDQFAGDVKLSVYASSPGICMACSLREKCLTKKEDKKRGYRTLIADAFTPLRQEAYRRLLTDEGKDFYAKRKTEPESVFGNIRQNIGFRGFSLRGLPKNRGEFWLICGAHNLMKLVRHMNATQAIA